MANPLLSFIQSKNPENIWLQILLLLSIVMICIILYRNNKENFETNSKTIYVVKRNGDIYDDFYVKKYESIFKPKSECERVFTLIESTTHPSVSESNFLDIGCKTGTMVECILHHNYKVVGIESVEKEQFINQIKDSATKNAITVNNIMDSSIYDKNVFSHILCLNTEFYNYKDSIQLFQNASRWLRSGGYFIVQLVDKPRFNGSVPIEKQYETSNSSFGRSELFSSEINTNQTLPSAIKKQLDDDYTYSVSYDKKIGKPDVLVKETFTDSKNGEIARINESILYIKELGDILNEATLIGFTFAGKATATLSDNNISYIYFFEKP